MEELRVAEIRALSNLGETFLEVAGKLVMRHGRRLFDHANHPDPLMDLEEASLRFHARAGSSPWHEAPGLTVNRDQILLLAPRNEADSTAPVTRGPGREVLLNLICGSVQVGGAVTVPGDVTITGFIHQSNSRFLAVSRPRIRPNQDGISLGDFQDGISLCYVNRNCITACIERRPTRA